MALIVPNEAERNMLFALIHFAWGGTYVDLFQNDLTPDENTVLDDFVTDDMYAGYAQQEADFTDPLTDVTGRGYILSGTITFPLATAGSMSVYGWVMTSSSHELICCKRFAAPITVTTTAGVDGYAIKFTLRQEP